MNHQQLRNIVIVIALALAGTPLVKVDSIGVRVLSVTEDIANARLVLDHAIIREQ